MDKVLLSLCIPTYGVAEWVFPVLDSIYCQGVDESEYEVVITDNGNNEEFERLLFDYAENHKNLIYKKTNSYSFLNEIDSYKLANGKFIKFVNHRTLMLSGSIQRLLQFVHDNADEKPCIYFSNGVLGFTGAKRLNSFDGFVRELSYFSSWSTGMAFWKEDFERITAEEKFNDLFPHTNILFHERQKSEYIIDNMNLLEEIPVDSGKKGKYDLFYAFAVEYLAIIQDLLREGSITTETFLSVKKDNLYFLAKQYLDFVIRKKKCSYDLSSFQSSVKVYYSKSKVINKIFPIYLKKVKHKLFRKK